jgi:hypothetical protein
MQTQYKHRLTTPINWMSHLHIQWKRNEETRKLFQEMQMRIAFRTRNTTKHSKTPPIKSYKKNGVYQMKCMDCPLIYTGQTGWIFYTRYKQHVQAIRNNNAISGYSNHILNTGHMWEYNSYTENHKNRQKGKTTKYIRKIEHIQGEFLLFWPVPRLCASQRPMHCWLRGAHKFCQWISMPDGQ